AFRTNALGTRHVVEGARVAGARVCFVSTDYVFDGTGDRPWVEWDAPAPLSVYGRSKLGGERELDPGATIVRTSWVCGAHGRNFVKTMLRAAAERDELTVVDDQHGCPTFTSDLAGAIVRLVVARLPGTFHVTNQAPRPGSTSPERSWPRPASTRPRFAPSPRPTCTRPAPRDGGRSMARKGSRRGIRRVASVLGGLLTMSSVGGLLAAPSSAVPVAAGYKDHSYAGTTAPTAEKPQSKLWYDDGLWWGVL